jgi:hypothetical protein
VLSDTVGLHWGRCNCWVTLSEGFVVNTRELIMQAAGIRPVELPKGCYIVPVAPKPEPEKIELED